MMFKRLSFSILFVIVLSLSSDGYSEPGTIMLDFDKTGDVNTEPGFTSFLISDSGTEVNGISIDLSGDINDCRRPDPNSGSGIPIYTEEIYRDFIYGVSPSGVNITLHGLGSNQQCDITIYAFDAESIPARLANWTANGDYLLTTEFEGGDAFLWPSPWFGIDYQFGPETATADEFGRIVLESTRNSSSPEGEDFAFVNALVAVPKGTYIPPPYAQHPLPMDGAANATADVILEWIAGGYADAHDVYLGTNESDVNDANRSNPVGVLVSQDQEFNTYDPPELFHLDTTYYWRIDEVNDVNIWAGEVWNFTTLPYFVMEDFDSYEDDSALGSVWENGDTSAEVSVESAITLGGKAMKCSYKNNLPPYYSEVRADIVDFGIDDPDWLGIGAEALSLYLYGQPTNPIAEQMYVRLTDGDNPPGTATVAYDNMNDTRLKQWNTWGIALTELNDVNLANVASITIGFGDGAPGDSGTLYIEGISLDAEEQILAEVDCEVDVNTVYQELEGFGAAGAWHEWEIPSMPELEREEFFDVLFSESGLDIYRLRNTYDQSTDGGAGYIDNSADIVVAAKLRNPSLKIMISSWSPPAYLKSNNQLPGGTLKKDPNDGEFMYEEFAEWWADSLEDWNNHGVVADYINIQNEPEIETSYSSCVLLPSETTNYAGYDTAFEAVWQELNTRMGPNMPKMLVSDCVGLNSADDYIDDIDNLSHVYGYAHHLYNGGGSYNYPDGYRNNMINFRNNYNDKPRMQTEFAKLPDNGDVTTFTEAMNLAQIMHNALVFEDVSAYLYWELFWTPPKGLVSHGYTINPVYYAFKQYAAFTDPGWYRVEASTNLGSLGNVRISVFKSPDSNELTFVIINLAYSDKNITLDVNGFLPDNAEIYRTSETENTAYIGPFNEGSSLMLPARSITTIHSPALSNCDGILLSGYGLTSDIHPDCYINYKDLKVITDYWLGTDCSSYGDCEGADFEPADGTVDLFDLSTFAQQWMWCNNPEDSNCSVNW